MARSKSMPGEKPTRTRATTKTNSVNTGVANGDQQSGNGESPNPPELTMSREVPSSRTSPGIPAPSAPAASVSSAGLAVESKPVSPARASAAGDSASKSPVSPEPRKMEVVKTDARKNLVPINLDDEIRRRAYELFQQRGSGPGSEADDWLTAEREVRQRYRQQSA